MKNMVITIMKILMVILFIFTVMNLAGVLQRI